MTTSSNSLIVVSIIGIGILAAGTYYVLPDRDATSPKALQPTPVDQRLATAKADKNSTKAAVAAEPSPIVNNADLPLEENPVIQEAPPRSRVEEMTETPPGPATEAGIIALTAPSRDERDRTKVEPSIPPYDVLPTQVSMHSLNDNTDGRVPENYVSPGDRVRIAYRMFSASTGALVEDSGDGGLLVRAGMQHQGRKQSGDGEIESSVPSVLAEALSQSYAGDAFELVFPVGMADLPFHFDPNDAYVLEVEIVGRE